jgi:hypothetical protein
VIEPDATPAALLRFVSQDDHYTTSALLHLFLKVKPINGFTVNIGICISKGSNCFRSLKNS